MDTNPSSVDAALGRAGYRATAARRAVVDLIAGREGHFTAADLVDDAQQPRPAHRTRHDLPHARRPGRAAGGRADRPAERRSRVCRLRAGHHHHVVCSRLRPEPGYRRCRPPRRSCARSPGRPATRSTSTGSSCSAGARTVSLEDPPDARSPWSCRSAPSRPPSSAAGWRCAPSAMSGVIIAVGAGIRIGAAFFDLIPEAVEHLGSIDLAMLVTTVGFLAFYALDKVTSLHVGQRPRRSSTTTRPATSTSASWGRAGWRSTASWTVSPSRRR